MIFKHLNKQKFSNIHELEGYITGLGTTKAEGDAFEEFTYAYFLINSDIYNIDKIYMESDIPSSLREKYKLEFKDNGVDGLFIKNDGKAVAYQVKFRRDRSSASYSELATFWAESEYCDERCIFSNCYLLPQQAGKKKKQFQIINETLDSLDEEFFEKVFVLATTNKIIKPEKHKPYEYQDEIINDVIKGFKTSNRGKIICACGTGKTLTALWIKERLEAKNTLFVVPSLALIRQTLVEWRNQCNVDFSHLEVCSDTTISDESDDSFIEKASNSSIPVTTSPNEIKDFLESEGNHVIFSTYQSLDAIVSAMLLMGDFEFDFCVFDEAHRTAGNKDSKMFTLGLDDALIKIKKRLFMTATERIATPRLKQLAKDEDYVIFSMDDVSVYGPVFSTLNFGEAISKKIINDYKIIFAAIKNQDISTLIAERRKLSIFGSGSIDSDTLLKQILLARAVRDIGISKTISYHTTVDKAKTFVFGGSNAYSFDEVLSSFVHVDDKNVFLSHVNGSMSSAQRTQIFNDFKKSDIGLMTNASCLTEGVDIPAIDSVYFVDPKNSIINIIQAIGRALRKSKDKKDDYSYILIPLIVDDSVSNFSDINPQAFDTLHNVIQALREQDSRMAEEIDALNYRVATCRSGYGYALGGHLGIYIPSSLSLEDFSDSLSLRIATVNKNPSEKTIVTVEERTSGFTRVFRTFGDYNYESYRVSCIEPTIAKFKNDYDILSNSEIAINHNNVSHTVKMGLIEKGPSGYSLTDLGIAYKNKLLSFKDLFTMQMLRYFENNANTTSTLFPYRNFLKVMTKFEYITKLEFVFSLYISKGSSQSDVDDAIRRIEEIRNTYPNIELLSDENKKKVLSILNLKYGTEFNHSDIWTSRTTVYNQYNYFKNHVLCFDEIFTDDKQTEAIIRKENGEQAINELLSLDESYEKQSLSVISKLYKQLR